MVSVAQRSYDYAEDFKRSVPNKVSVKGRRVCNYGRKRVLPTARTIHTRPGARLHRPKHCFVASVKLTLSNFAGSCILNRCW
jgi:hypothetical protein